MLGNFSFGDYFKREAIDFAWELSLEGFGFDPEQIWITVFGGDEELGLGPDDGGDRALEASRRPGGADRRAAALGELLAGRRHGPLRALLGALHRPRRGVRRRPTTAPATTTTATSSTGTSSSPPTSCTRTARSPSCRRKNIDTGLGLERMAAIKQGVDSVFDTDLLRPLVDLARRALRPPLRRRRRRPRRGRCGSSPTTSAARSS